MGEILDRINPEQLEQKYGGSAANLSSFWYYSQILGRPKTPSKNHNWTLFPTLSNSKIQK
jgi:hypothetical protein